MNPFDPGYYRSDELRSFGFARVGEGSAIARNCTIHGLENISLGDRVRIDGYTTLIATRGSITIGSNVHICSGCVIGGRGTVVVRDFSSLSHGVKLLSAVDDYSGERMTNSTLPAVALDVQEASIEIGPHAPLGSNVLLLPGAKVSEGTAVHALSIVCTHLPEWTICAGNPAVPIRRRSRNLLRFAPDLTMPSENEQLTP